MVSIVIHVEIDTGQEGHAADILRVLTQIVLANPEASMHVDVRRPGVKDR